MFSHRVVAQLPLVVLALVVLAWSPAFVHAQIAPAGVDVDADGVLRTKVIHDPSGRLTRERFLAEKAALDPDVARPSKLRKISLNRLEAAIAAQREAGKELTRDMKYLVGLTRLTHVFFYPDTNDIVIAGPAEGYGLDISGRAVGIVSGQSVLELEDLVTALRAFPASGAETGVISVSIDPTRDGLTNLQKFLSGLRGITPRDDVRIAQGLRDSLGLQVVSVRGISPKSHMAQVLVEADYRMKLIGIGLEKPAVNIASYVERANPKDVARNAMQRWYFTPNYECVRVSEDDLAMELVGDGVKLIGEDERVTAEGGRVGVKNTNRASEAFVLEFTKKYPELAQREPVYGQLRNMIDMLIAAAFIQDRDYYAQADWRMETFMDERAVPVEVHVEPKQVESAVNVIWKGSTLMTPIGGGVNIQPRTALDADKLLKDDGGKLGGTREQIKIKSLPKDQWWWD